MYAPECPYAWKSGRVPRARYAVWQAGVEIPNGYVVHHKDGDKLNDDLGNLEVIPSRVHRRHHMLGNKLGIGNQNHKGCVASDETRQKLSESHKGIAKTPEWRAAIAQAHLGKPKTCSICGMRGNRKTHPTHRAEVIQ